MERERLVHCKLLKNTLSKLYLFLVLAAFSGCSKTDTQIDSIYITFNSGFYVVKSADPNESKLTDVSLLIFDEYGRKEADLWIEDNLTKPYRLSLTTGKKYRFVATANFGFRLNVTHADKLKDVKYHLSYPDEYREGIPMYADTGFIDIKDGMTLKLKFIRLMSKISIRLDKSKLSKDVEMNIAGIRIGNCPRVISVFDKNKVNGQDECFPLGFNKTNEDCSALNHMESYGISYPVSLYMLENMQGGFSDNHINNDSEKIFDEYDPRRETCSYIELDIDYLSSTQASTNGFLKYRFYLGEDKNNLDIERNCHYKITITPEDDGLKDDSWRVDKSSLTSLETTSFSYYPESYIRGNIGEKVHIGCVYTPQNAPFDIGREYMEYDKQEGIYDYEIDDDGRGAVLTLTGPGAGLIYMSVGPPVNESALWFIEVNLPSQNIESYSLPR